MIGDPCLWNYMNCFIVLTVRGPGWASHKAASSAYAVATVAVWKPDAVG